MRPDTKRLDIYVNEVRLNLLAKARRLKPAMSVSKVLFEALKVAVDVWSKEAGK